MLLVVGSTGGEATYGGAGVVAFLFSFRPTMRRGKRVADTQNHTAFTCARNRSVPRQVDSFKIRNEYICICVYRHMHIKRFLIGPLLNGFHTYSIIYTHTHVTTRVNPP